MSRNLLTAWRDVQRLKSVNSCAANPAKSPIKASNTAYLSLRKKFARVVGRPGQQLHTITHNTWLHRLITHRNRTQLEWSSLRSKPSLLLVGFVRKNGVTAEHPFTDHVLELLAPVLRVPNAVENTITNLNAKMVIEKMWCWWGIGGGSVGGP